MIKIDWTCKRQKFTALNEAPRNEENSNEVGGGGGVAMVAWRIKFLILRCIQILKVFGGFQLRIEVLNVVNYKS